MQEQMREEIRNLAHGIDVRVNLFEGFAPKKIDTYRGELLFWREIVSVYGLFADCDRVQIKEKENLFDLLNRYSLIEKEEYDSVKRFWEDISNLRKWFCHNNDLNLFFVAEKEKRIGEYLSNAFVLATNKPNSINDVQLKDWGMLCFDIERRYEEYLRTLKKGLEAWQNSSEKGEICDQWYRVLSKALYNDKELIKNVLADIATFRILNDNTHGVNASVLSNRYFSQLSTGGFSAEDIEDELRRNSTNVRSNREIIYSSILNSKLI